MMLSISGKMRTLLKKLKSKPSLRIEDCFPHCLSDQFREVWNEFLSSLMVKNILSRHGTNIIGQYYVVALFLSYMSRFTKVPSNLGAFDLYEPSPIYKRMTTEINHLKLLSKLNLTFHSHSFKLQAEDVAWARCLIDVRCTGILTYKLNGRTPLEAYLSSLSPSVFKTLPKELYSDKSKDKKKRRDQKLVTPEQQINSSYGWVPLFSNNEVRVEVARARYSTIILRYFFTIPGFFCYGSGDPARFSRQLRTKHEASAFIPK